jgi:hypothetical protein
VPFPLLMDVYSVDVPDVFDVRPWLLTPGKRKLAEALAKYIR